MLGAISGFGFKIALSLRSAIFLVSSINGPKNSSSHSPIPVLKDAIMGFPN